MLFAAFNAAIVQLERRLANLLGLLETCDGAASGVLPTLFRCRPLKCSLSQDLEPSDMVHARSTCLPRSVIIWTTIRVLQERVSSHSDYRHHADPASIVKSICAAHGKSISGVYKRWRILLSSGLKPFGVRRFAATHSL